MKFLYQQREQNCIRQRNDTNLNGDGLPLADSMASPMKPTTDLQPLTQFGGATPASDNFGAALTTDALSLKAPQSWDQVLQEVFEESELCQRYAYLNRKFPAN